MDLKVTRETSTQYREGIYICKVPQMLCGRNGAETQACLIPELVFFLCNVAPLGRCWLVNSSASKQSSYTNVYSGWLFGLGIELKCVWLEVGGCLGDLWPFP